MYTTLHVIRCHYNHNKKPWKKPRAYFIYTTISAFDKGKIVPVLNCAMKAHGGVDGYRHIFFISAVVGGE
jgi:hypothetical protein